MDPPTVLDVVGRHEVVVSYLREQLVNGMLALFELLA